MKLLALSALSLISFVQMCAPSHEGFLPDGPCGVFAHASGSVDWPILAHLIKNYYVLLLKFIKFTFSCCLGSFLPIPCFKIPFGGKYVELSTRESFLYKVLIAFKSGNFYLESMAE